MTADFRTASRNNLVFFVAALLVAHFGSTMASLLPSLSPAFALPRHFGPVLFVLSALTVLVAAGYELTGRQVGGRLVEAALVLVVVNLAVAAGDGGLRGIVRRLGSLSAFLDGATAGASVIALVVWNASTGFAANLVGLLEEDVEGIRLEYAGLARDRLTGCRGDLTVYLYHFRSVLSRTMLLGVAVSVAFAFARKYASLMPGLAPPDAAWFSARLMTQMALSLVLVSYAYYLRVQRTFSSLGARIDPSVAQTWVALTCVILVVAWTAWAHVRGPGAFALPDVSKLFSWVNMTPHELQNLAARAGSPEILIDRGVEQGPAARVVGDIVGAVLLGVAVAFGTVVAAFLGWIAWLVVRDEAEDLKGLSQVLAVVLIQVKAACLSLVELAVSGARALWYLVFRGRRYVVSRLGGGARAATTRRTGRIAFDRSPSGRVRRLYCLTLRLLARRGIRRLPADTPRDFLGAAAQAFPDVARDLAAMTDAYVAARYSREGVPMEVARDVLACYKDLLAHVRRGAMPLARAARRMNER